LSLSLFIFSLRLLNEEPDFYITVGGLLYGIIDCRCGCRGFAAVLISNFGDDDDIDVQERKFFVSFEEEGNCCQG